MRMAHHVYFRDADESLTVRFPSMFFVEIVADGLLSFVEFLLFSMIIFFLFFLLFLSVSCFVLGLQNLRNEISSFKIKIVRIEYI